jgi:D-amino peptidase
MMAGVSEGFDASMLIGYHGKRDSPSGVIGHTYSYDVSELRLNGVLVGETGISAAIAGHFGVPVVMVAGEQNAIDDIRSLIPEVLGVVTKSGVGLYGARSLSPARSMELIRSGAEKAVKGPARVAPYVVSRPVHVEVSFTRVVMAQYVSKMPGVERTAPKSVSYTADDMVEAFDVFEVMGMVAESSGREGVL